MHFDHLCEKIQLLLSNSPLPGLEAQKRFAPQGRLSDGYNATPDHARWAAVLILLTKMDSDIYLPLIVRSDDGGAHAGQIAIPGGSWEADESYPVDTALREAEEEINLSDDKVKILGSLSPLFIPVSNFTVTPVLGCAEAPLSVYADREEAQEIVWFRLARLMDEAKIGEFYSHSSGMLIEAPYYDSPSGRIWGATAMMLSELAELLRISGCEPCR